MKRIVPLLLGLVFAGCATTSREVKSNFVGYYAMTKGGFNESMSAELARDGSYILEHELFACVIGPNGEMPITHSREEGVWRLEGGMILLEPKARTKDFPDASVFAPSLAHRLLPKQEGFGRLLVNADNPEYFVMRETQKPNQALQPTPAAENPANDAYSAPDSFPFQTKVDHIVAAFKKEGSSDKYVSLQGTCFCSRRRLLTEEERKAYVRLAANVIESVGIESADKPEYRRKLQAAIFDKLKQADPSTPVDLVWIPTVVIR